MRRSIPIVSSLNAVTEARLLEVVDDLATLAMDEGLDTLLAIEVVPDAKLAQRVNELLTQKQQHEGIQYTAAPHSPGGVTIPLENDRGVESHIILTERTVVLSPRSPQFVSLLLEELLHVESYAKLWRLRGYLQPRVPAHLRDLTTIAFKLQDEYVVSRRKAQLLGTEPLAEINGVLQPFWLQTREPLADHFNQSRHLLKGIVETITCGAIGFPENWIEVLRWLQRHVFEWLAYDAGYRAWRESPNQAVLEASQSRFFRHHVRHYWQTILTQLERTYDSDLDVFEDATDEIVTVLLAFLAHIGVQMDERGVVTFTQRFGQLNE